MMDLFSPAFDKTHNLLPADGEAYYHGPIIGNAEADQYLARLMADIDWRHDEAIIYGKHITTKRKVAWYGDRPFAYTYSNTTKHALPWTADLLALKKLAEAASGETYNSCLLNLYHDGSEGMAWHSDAEKDLKKNGAIGSLSFGAERVFAFKHKKAKTKIDVLLAHGSLLVMQGATQAHWLHRLPPTKKAKRPRVNLTFRTITTQSPQ